jgi:uncharacterized membrane protein
VALLDFLRPKPKDVFTEAQAHSIVEAIRMAEQKTSGEIRVYMESRCKYVDALDRAEEIFFKLKMDKTQLQNGTLIYIALKDKQMAIYGDAGIHQEVTSTFWKAEIKKMEQEFYQNNLTAGILGVIEDIGTALYKHYPYDAATDKNELPDEIVFGA